MDLNLNELANQDSFLQKSIQLSANRWKIFLYLLSSLEIVLCIVVMSLDINLSIHDLSELTKYLGFTQVI